ncbi:MAG: hypothetical protein FWD45_05260, partial [Coriobacteriia bacterium]|nr:hypothetical protein [Coriobacteriia bacterium]
TLYGDTAGAFAPFGSVYKTDLYGMAQWRNQRDHVIPAEILAKPPTAELYSGQLDSDTMPPYEILDRILRLHIEDNMGLDQILDIIINTPGVDPIEPEIIGEVLRQVNRSEFKRRQGPISPSIGSVNMNTSRAWPITNGFVDRSRGLSSFNQSSDLMNRLRDWKRPDDWGFLSN